MNNIKTTVEYAYDPLLRLIERKTIGQDNTITRRQYVYKDWNKVMELYEDTGGNLSLRHMYANGELSADDTMARLDCQRKGCSGGAWSFFIQNEIWTREAILTMSDFSFEWSGLYTTYGIPVPGGTDNIAFTGRAYDGETKLYNMRFRWYEPESGRFLNRDYLLFPLYYRYYGNAINNPVNWRDPSGLQAEAIGITGIFAGAGEWAGAMVGAGIAAAAAAGVAIGTMINRLPSGKAGVTIGDGWADAISDIIYDMSEPIERAKSGKKNAKLFKEPGVIVNVLIENGMLEKEEGKWDKFYVFMIVEEYGFYS